MWCIPPEQNADFAAKMEDILDVYAMPHDEKRPVVCIDEKPYQLPDEVREPLEMRPGSSGRIDSEYKRCGTSSIFVSVEPLTGWRRAHARERRTAVGYAEEIEFPVKSFPNAEKILLVQDNLNTHAVSSLYKAFPAPKAREIVRKLEVHYTPKHGSRLNIAEIMISVLSRQCIDRRIPGMKKLNAEIAAWEEHSNSSGRKIEWHFTTEDARVKLKSLYPVF